MGKPVKILHVMNGATLGGISTVVLNYYKNMNREKFRFDCAMYNLKLGPNGKALKQLGCDMFFLPLKSKHPFKYIKNLTRIIKNGQYDVIHVHNNKTSYVALMVAKVLGVPIRIAHSHTAVKSVGMKTRVRDIASHLITPKAATHLLACSGEAAVSIFGNSQAAKQKISILKNAIDVGKFSFDLGTRESMREALEIDNELVIGTVGNLGPEKNHKYLLEVFAELIKLESNAKLIIVGEGVLREELERCADKLAIAESTLFLGRRTDVNQMLMAFDIFVMPSLYEGFPIAALEAVASGLPIYLSENITKDLQFATRYRFLSIDVAPRVWAKELHESSFAYDRLDGAIEVIKNGYDISENVKYLEKIYEGNRC